MHSNETRACWRHKGKKAALRAGGSENVRGVSPHSAVCGGSSSAGGGREDRPPHSVPCGAVRTGGGGLGELCCPSGRSLTSVCCLSGRAAHGTPVHRPSGNGPGCAGRGGRPLQRLGQDPAAPPPPHCLAAPRPGAGKACQSAGGRALAPRLDSDSGLDGLPQTGVSAAHAPEHQRPWGGRDPGRAQEGTCPGTGCVVRPGQHSVCVRWTLACVSQVRV